MKNTKADNIVKFFNLLEVKRKSDKRRQEADATNDGCIIHTVYSATNSISFKVEGYNVPSGVLFRGNYSDLSFNLDDDDIAYFENKYKAIAESARVLREDMDRLEDKMNEI